MQELTAEEMTHLEGSDFWGGVGCGLGLAAAFYASVSPDPFSKIALVTYGGTAMSCARLMIG